MTTDPWVPERYERFALERSQPFFDLLSLVRPGGPLRVVDLGCGTGDLTRVLHLRLGARETLGLDASPAMLARAARLAGAGLRFELGNIEDLAPDARFDVVFSNAALQWLPGHPALLARLAGALAPGGQLAFQIPMNDGHPSHTTAVEVAREPPFAEALSGFERRPAPLAPEAYAELLHALGFGAQAVRLQIYGHLLEGPEAVVEWVRATLLTDFERRLPAALFAEFLARYRARLLARLPDRRPYFYAYPRLLAWAAVPSSS